MATFINETEAAEKAGVAKETLREKCKSGAWKIEYNHRNQRHYRYSLQDINKLLNDPASVITGLQDRKSRWYQKKKAEMATA